MKALRRGLVRRAALVAFALALVAATLLAGDHGNGGVATTADISQFNPGNIISDGVFFNAAAMNASDISAFIQSKEMTCHAASDGTPCLKNYTQTTTTRAADSYCAGYSGAANEGAAIIIAKVATSCGINPQVLLVIMQKEQGLVTDSGSSLYANRYLKAMGYACPDTAACDTTYYGFQNQVYSAAWQYRKYAANPSSYGYRAGRTVNIQWSPDATCGSAPVYIQNQATAGLYIYTPYQPNAAALAAGYGLGDGCSAYGNRNFWLYFTDWFGSTQGPGGSAWNPIGSLDSPVVGDRVAHVSGWAADPDDLTAAIAVHVYVDGAFQQVLQADQYDADITGNHGYVAQIPVTVGTHTLCTYGINIGRGGNALLGCSTFTVPATTDSTPTGVMTAKADGRYIDVAGWSVDTDALSTPIAVHVYADGVGVAILQANQGGAPSDTYFSGSGDAHGYSTQLSLGAGAHNICTYGINVNAGAGNSLLGCYSVSVDPAAFNPIGSWDSMTKSQNMITVSGWSQDLDTAGPNPVHVYVDGAGTAILTADQPNPTVNGHGFATTIPLAVGAHTVCLYSINVGEGTGNVGLGCRPVTVTEADYNPAGTLDAVVATGGTVTVVGHATDPDIPSGAVTVPVYVDGGGVTILIANGPDATANGHGYTGSFVLPDGPHTVCTYGTNVGHGTTNVLLGCQPVTVSAAPTGVLSTVTAVGSSVTVTGYASDPDTTGPIPVHVYVDGHGAAVLTADQPNDTLPNHGYLANLSLSQGAHWVCTYGINVGPGPGNTLLGCRSVTVSASPSGVLDPVTSFGQQVTVSGFAADPDTTGPISVHVYVDGSFSTVLTANGTDARLPNHGYSTTLTLSLGTHSVCTYGINVGAGGNQLLGCQTIQVSRNPIGTLDPVQVAAGSVSVSGYAMDPDTSAAIPVHVYIDGHGVAVLTADGTNTTAAGHGYAATVPVAAGEHGVCTYGINVGPGGNVLLGCQVVGVP